MLAGGEEGMKGFSECGRRCLRGGKGGERGGKEVGEVGARGGGVVDGRGPEGGAVVGAIEDVLLPGFEPG